MRPFALGAISSVAAISVGAIMAIPSAHQVRIKKLSSEVRKKYHKRFPRPRDPDYLRIFSKVPSFAEVELGRFLFSDPVLSRNNDVSCATCHLSNHGFADGNSLTAGALGRGGPSGENVGPRYGTGKLSVDRSLGDDGLGAQGRRFMFRNSLSTINVIYRGNDFTNDGLFHDGRFGNLMFQVLLPIHTPEEMCGDNPLALTKGGENLFRAYGPIFRRPVALSHANSFDPYSGRDTGKFNALPVEVEGIPFRRKNGHISIPNRNECLALALAKLRASSGYQQLFQRAFGPGGITQKRLSRALVSFVGTHVANRTPYDEFVAGKDVLSAKLLVGLAIFFTDVGETFSLGGQKHKGAGCFHCHDQWTFGGDGFASLGVISDSRSSLTQHQLVFRGDNGFFFKTRVQRGILPTCHVEGVSASSKSNYAPDMGRASASLRAKDCFKFRIPPLRNVIETFPYFHHGTERAQGHGGGPYHQARKGLENVIRYHLRGPVNTQLIHRANPLETFFDDFYQKDPLVPYRAQNFHRLDGLPDHGKFPVPLKEEDLQALVEFVAYGLWDRTATSKGHLGHDLSHPRTVPSGLSPSISRDEGTQLDFPSR